MFLDENCTCFVRDGKTYCRKDYARLFGAKCDKCQHPFGKDDYVMRANKKIFHIKESIMFSYRFNIHFDHNLGSSRHYQGSHYDDNMIDPVSLVFLLRGLW